LAQHLLYLDGQPFSLGDYPFYHAIYDGNYQGMLLKSGRQVAKSTTLCNFLISEGIGTSHFRSLYVSPSQEQTRKFSNTRVGKVCLYSPLIKQYWVDASELSQRTMLRMFRNGSEISFTYALDDPDRARGNTADRCCYDGEAQVLTKRGWVSVCALASDDLVADVTDAGRVDWSAPMDIFTKKFTGRMITFRHRGFQLRVTDDHKMWVNFHVKADAAYKQSDDYVFVPAGTLATTERMGFKMTCVAEWSASTPAWRHFNGTPTRMRGQQEALQLPYTAFARLVGWYIAEGHISWRRYRANGARKCPRPVLTQNVSRGLQDITDTIDACGLQYNVGRGRKGAAEARRVIVGSETLGWYFADLGKSYDKYIPREFFESPALLEQILQGIYLGDASYHRGEAWQNGTLRTRSRRLAEDVQEAWLRLGRPAVIHTRQMTGAPLYEVLSYNRDYLIFWRAEFNTKRRVIVEQVTDEDVYCFTVKHHRPIVKGTFRSLPVVCSNCYDEVQDILYEPVIPVINECMGNSEYGYETYAGTPKTMENTIEYLWSISTQNEWIMKCDGCGRYSFIDNAKAVGKVGPVCVKCDHALNPRNGQWYSFKPEATLTGFHIPQLILPRNAEQPNRWQRILTKLARYSDTKFKNEVLGISDALGARIISKQELEALCEDYDIYRQPSPGINMEYRHVVGGVDWSGGGTEGVSRTVVWIWAVTKNHQLRTLYYRVYPITSPVSIVDDVAEALQAHHVELVIGDRGEGHLANDLLAQRLGSNRVSQVMYGAQARTISWNEKGLFYTADRTTLMDNYFMVLKRQGVIFPRLSCMLEPITDILNIYEEVTVNGKKVWRHAPTQPDDCFHAQLFGWLAAKVLLMDLTFTG